MKLASLMNFNPRVNAIARLCRRLYGEDPAHGWPHILRVISWAERIVNSEGLDVDPEVLVVSILLHDIGRLEGGSGYHAVRSSEIANIILEVLGYDSVFRDTVSKAILAHSYSLGYKAENVEAMVLSDADKLDALGAIGIARVFHVGALMNRGFEDSLEHFRTKIVRLKDLMYFNYSRRIAEVLVARVIEYLKWWSEELQLLASSQPLKRPDLQYSL